ncbi:hypothetical protein SAMN04488126_102210 [Bhargavaea beijingensis]|uniref:Uncharacterized protein n=1 Tax=Bhargavaea beijingensis TaxID=426756 RepID=A0A1G6Z7P3_9BACL|nr:hypothetical protein SAMN04488126_102210 [Bhargavaea beijingensis]
MNFDFADLRWTQLGGFVTELSVAAGNFVALEKRFEGPAMSLDALVANFEALTSRGETLATRLIIRSTRPWFRSTRDEFGRTRRQF